MMYRKIDFTFWCVTLYKTALKCITLNKMKKSLVHYGENALVFWQHKKTGFNYVFWMFHDESPYSVWALIYALHLRYENFLLGWQGNLVSHYIWRKKLFEEMMYRKIDFIFWGVTLFKRALKCITQNKMKKSLLHYRGKCIGVSQHKKLGFNSIFWMYH